MATLLFIIALLAGSLLFAALIVWLGARFAKAEQARFSRALFATIVIWLVNGVSTLAAFWFAGVLKHDGLLLAGEGLLLLAQLVISWLIIARVMRCTFARASLIWLAGLLPTMGVVLALVSLVIKPFMVEAYVVPTNPMAPTIVGWHRTALCPRCQSALIVPAAPPDQLDPFQALERDQAAICRSCLASSMIQITDRTIHSPDRILVNKLLTPQRWDVIVFRYPRDPSHKYMMRLVGLPGETVYVKESALWVNGEKAELPPELAGLRYDRDDEVPGDMGTPERPWILGEEEYCVLGDFSQRSSDSRFWGLVPGANIEGVLGLCYWPMSRWRLFR